MLFVGYFELLDREFLYIHPQFFGPVVVEGGKEGGDKKKKGGIRKREERKNERGRGFYLVIIQIHSLPNKNSPGEEKHNNTTTTQQPFKNKYVVRSKNRAQFERMCFLIYGIYVLFFIQSIP